MLLRMISAWKRMGLPQDGVAAIAADSVNSLEFAEIQRMVQDVFNWDHNGYGCNDPILKEFCDPICKYYKSKNYGLDILNVNQLTEKFREFLTTDFSSTSFNLKGIYNIPNDYTFMPGELAVLIGDTKLGKTAWIQNLMVHLTHLNVLYLSLEVNDWMIFRRFLQVANGMTKDEVMNAFKENNPETISKLNKSVEHISVMTTPPDIDSMKQLISDVQPNIVVIDTMDAIEVRYNNDPFNKMEKIVNKLKQIANAQDVIFFGISHISKGASKEMLTVHSAKGNSSIEQKADKIIGISGDKDMSQRRVIKSLASRDETDFELVCMFDYKTFEFQETS